ncbi:MAG: GNAT family N-acetyltransferase [Clostridia bacterium]|nr:GNAT family N-acetyltransferase [Clostridia bacterium]
MLKFKKLTDKNFKEIQSFMEKCDYPLCDYSGGVIFTWYLAYNDKSEFAIYENTLILKFGKEHVRFMLPVGEAPLKAIEEIENYCVYNDILLNFICVDEKNLEFIKIRYEEKAKISFNRNYSDYIYDINEMKSFSGKKFSGQRNHINAFKKTYPNYVYKKTETKDIKRIKAFLEEYNKQYPKKGKIEKKEFEFTHVLLKYVEKGYLISGYVENNGEIVGFSIGEYSGETLIIHVEKALLKYRGAYPLTYNEFVNNFYKENIKYVNREDDSGDSGLRISKTQYKPILLANKYYVQVKGFMPEIKKPTLRSKRLVISPITKKDVNDYYKLSVCVKNNKWWGYDYKKDIKNPSVSYFYSGQIKDYKKRKSMCLAVREKASSKMIGEVVLYNFTYDNKVEIGIRLFKNYQGKGYGREAVKTIRDFAVEKLKLLPCMKCFKENIASKKMIEKCGFVETKQDEKYFYFKF